MLLENGDIKCLTIPAFNNAGTTATGTKITVVVPPGISVQAATPSQGSYNQTTNIWTIGDLLGNSTENLVICFLINDVTLEPFEIKSYIEANEIDPKKVDNIRYDVLAGITCEAINSCVTGGLNITFQSLTDTPATGTPNYILGYNAAGDAVIAIDPTTLGGSGTDTFATLNGSILTLADGQTYDLAHTVDTDTFASISGTVITFADGTSFDLSSTDTFATLNGNVITFPDGQTLTFTDTDTTYTVASTNQIALNLSATNEITATFAAQPTTGGTNLQVLQFDPATGNYAWVTNVNGDTSIVTGVAPTGNVIATHNDGTGTLVNIRETLTTLVAHTDNTNLRYTNESGIITQVDLTDIVENLETNTVISLNGTNLSYVDENGVTTNLDLSTILGNASAVTNVINGNLIARHTNGDGVVVDIDETITALTIAGSVLSYTNEAGVINNIDLSTLSTAPSAVTNTIVGNRVATHDDGTGNTVDINETITTLGLAGAQLTYTAEDGTATTLTLPTTTVTTADTNCLDLNITGTGTTADPYVITGQPIINTAIDNSVSCLAGGLYVPGETTTTLTYSNFTNVLNYTDEDGTVTAIDLSPLAEDTFITGANFDITSMILTLTDNSGNTNDVTVDLSTLRSEITNTVTGHTIATHNDGTGTTVNINETITSLILTGNTLVYENETSVLNTIDLSGIESNTSLAFNPVTNILTYTSEDGTVSNLDLSSLDSVSTVNNLINGNRIATHVNGDGVSVDIEETITTAALNADNTNIDYTNETGNTNQLNLTNLVKNLETTTSFVYNNANNTLTYTDEDGNTTVADLSSLTSDIFVNGGSYNNATMVLTLTDNDPTTPDVNIDLSTLQSVITNTVPGNTIATHNDGGGTTININETITSLTYNSGDHSLSYTGENGNVAVLNLENPTVAFSNVTNQLTFTAPDGTVTQLDLSDLAGTSILTNLVTGNRIATHTNSDGTVTEINETVTSIGYNAATRELTYVSESGIPTVITFAAVAESLTTLQAVPATCSLTYTDENGTANQINLAALFNNCETTTTLTFDTVANTLNYTDEDGVITTLSLGDSVMAQTVTAGNQIATHTSGTGVVTNVFESVTTATVDANNQLTYTSENGTVTTFNETTTTLTVSPAGILSYTDEDGVVNNVDVCAVIPNCETTTTLTYVTATNTLSYTDEDGTVTAINLNTADGSETIINVVDTNCIDMTLTGSGTLADPYSISTATIINPIANNTISCTATGLLGVETDTTLTYNALTTTLTYTSETGAVTNIDLSALTSDIFVNGGTYDSATMVLTLTDNDATTPDVSIDLSTLQSAITNVVAGNRIATHNSGNGTLVDINETITSTTYNNATNVLTYTGEDGTATNITLAVGSVSYVAATNILTYTAEDGTVTNIDLTDLAGVSVISNLVAGNRIATHTDADGTAVDINETITTLTYDAGTHALTYTAEGGASSVIALDNPTLAYTAASQTLTFTSPSGVVTNLDLSALADPSVVTNVIAGNRIATHTNSDGTAVDINETITSVALSGTDSISYTNESGVVTVLDLTAIVKSEETNTTLSLAGNILTYTNEDGVVTNLTIPADIVTNITDLVAGNLIGTYTNEVGTTFNIDETITTIAYNAATRELTYTSESGVPTVITFDAAVETVTTLQAVAATCSLTYTDENGTANNVDLAPLIAGCETTTTLTFNAGTNTLSYTNEDGVVNNLVLGNSTMTQTITVGSQIASHTSGTGVVTNILQTNTTATVDANNQLTYTSENGTVTNFNERTTTLTISPAGILSYTDEDGVVNNVDVCGVIPNCETTTTLTYAPVTNTLSYTDEDGVLTVLNLNTADGSETIINVADTNCIDMTLTGSGTVADPYNISTATIINPAATNTISCTPTGLLGVETNTTLGYNAVTTVLTYTSETGAVTNIDLSALAADIFVNGGTYNDATMVLTLTDNDAATPDVTIDLSSLQSVITNVVAGNLIATHDAGNGTIVNINETITSTAYNAATNVLTYTAEDGTATPITLEVGTIAYDALTNTITYTAEDGTVTQLDLTDLVAPSVLTNLIAGNRIATHTSGDGTVLEIDETITTVALNADNTNIDYTAEGGAVTQLDLTALVQNLETDTSLVANADNVNIDYTAEDGLVDQVDMTAIVANLETTTTLALADRTLTYTDEDGVVTNLIVPPTPVTVLDTNCIDLTLTGVGTTLDPYVVSAAPILNPLATNQLTCTATGLLVNGETVTVNANGGQTPFTNPPANPISGDEFINTVDNTQFIYNGTVWITRPALGEDGETATQDNTGGNIPAVLADPTVIAAPINGDAVVQRYANGVVLSVRSAGAWVNTAIPACCNNITINGVAGQTPGSNPPANPIEGDEFINTVDNTQFIYDGTVWVARPVVGDGEAIRQDNTGGNVPAVLVNPTAIAVPINGDLVVQAYDDGVVLSTFQGGAWVNTRVVGADGETQQQVIATAVPAALVNPTVIATPVAGDAVLQVYNNGTVISTFNGAAWTNTLLTSVADGETISQDNTGGNIPAVPVDPTVIAVPINGDAVWQEYDNGYVLSTFEGGAWVNKPLLFEYTIQADIGAANQVTTLETLILAGVNGVTTTLVGPDNITIGMQAPGGGGTRQVYVYDDGAGTYGWVDTKALNPFDTFASDALAGAGGILIGEQYALDNGNIYGETEGMIKTRIT